MCPETISMHKRSHCNANPRCMPHNMTCICHNQHLELPVPSRVSGIVQYHVVLGCETWKKWPILEIFLNVGVKDPGLKPNPQNFVVFFFQAKYLAGSHPHAWNLKSHLSLATVTLEISNRGHPTFANFMSKNFNSHVGWLPSPLDYKFT